MKRGVIELLGTGTSQGVPFLACNCDVCHSTDPKDKRYRCSALLRVEDGPNILIDCGTDFRMQAIRAKIKKIDYVLISHGHADHIHGLDDLRQFSLEKNLQLFCNSHALNVINTAFDYAVKYSDPKFMKPHLTPVLVESESLTLDGIKIIPIPIMHGKLPIYGWRLGNTAYITDCKTIPEESYALLQGIENLLINGLQINLFETHLSFSEALDEIEKIKPKRSWFIHMNHYSSHQQIIEYIAQEREKRPNLNGIEIAPAYDTMIVDNVVFSGEYIE